MTAPSSNGALLEVRDLTSWYATPAGLTRAVNGVSLDVKERQAVGVVGQSGSGKTQTFFSIFGLSHGVPGVIGGSARFAGVDLLENLSDHVRISEGNGDGEPTIQKNGPRWDRIHQSRLRLILGRQVAMMFQDPRRSLIPYWPVRRHLVELLARSGDAADVEARAAELLSRFGFREIDRVLKEYPGNLSGGQAQRVMLAMSTAMQPRLLVADEPTTALDAVNQVRVLRELERLHAESDLALVLISHDLSVVGHIVEHLYIFLYGKVVEHGPTSILTQGSSDMHPYTLELRESQRRRTRGLPIEARLAPATEAVPIHGCAFAHRCPLRPRLTLEQQVKCTSEAPPLVAIAADRGVACWGVAP